MIRKNLFLSFILFFTICIGTYAQKLSPNTEAFLLRPVNPVTRSAFSTDNAPEQAVKAYISISHPDAISKMRSLGAEVYLVSSNILTASLPKEHIKVIAEIPEVNYIQLASKVYPTMDIARGKGNVDKVHNATALEKAYSGSGIVVGIIDQGFQYDHINFYSSDKKNYRVKRVWDQNKADTTSPSPFNYGAEYTTEAEILALQTDTRTTSHGTHVTGIAAGGDKTKGFQGIATDADIVLVSYAQGDVDITNAIKYIYDYAESVSKPCVVNMSLGSHYGPHDGTSVIDRLADQLQGPGRLLVGAAGNEGEDLIHLSHSFTPANNTVKTMLAYNNDNSKIGLIDVWGNEGGKFSIQGCIVSTTNGTVLETTELFSTDKTDSKRTEFHDNTPLDCYITIAVTVNPENGRPNAYVETAASAMPSNRAIGIIVTAENGKVDMWHAQGGYFTNKSKAGWQSGNSTSTCGEIGGTGHRIISVGAYISKDRYTALDGNTYTFPAAKPIDGIAGFSSRGPTLDGRMKPDITAPGMALSSSVSSLANEFDRSAATAVSNKGMKSYYYGMMSGTSMASPFVTGTLALWLEANPKLTPENVKTILQETAINDSYTGNVSDKGSNIWGYGKIDTYNGLLATINMASGIEDINRTKTNIRASLDTDGKNLLLFFPNEDKEVCIKAFHISGTMASEQRPGEVASGQVIAFSVSSWEPGMYVLKITGKKYNESIKVMIR